MQYIQKIFHVPFIGVVFTMMAKLVDNVNNYVLVFAGCSGEGYTHSSHTTTRLLRRNMMFGFFGGTFYISFRLILFVCI